MLDGITTLVHKIAIIDKNNQVDIEASQSRKADLPWNHATYTLHRSM